MAIKAIPFNCLAQRPLTNHRRLTLTNDNINCNKQTTESARNGSIGDITDWNDQEQAEFDWTPETIGVVDSSFFWGYIVTQIPGGFLAARYPANRVFGSAIATSAFLNMLLPVAAKAGFQYVMLLRILQGLVEVSKRFDFKLAT